MLLFGAAFPDGSKSSTGAHPHIFFGGTEELDPPVLLMRNGGGNGGDDELSGFGSLLRRLRGRMTVWNTTCRGFGWAAVRCGTRLLFTHLQSCSHDGHD